MSPRNSQCSSDSPAILDYHAPEPPVPEIARSWLPVRPRDRILLTYLPVAAIVTLILWIILPPLRSGPPPGYRQAQAEIIALKTKVNAFQADCGRYPTAAE